MKLDLMFGGGAWTVVRRELRAAARWPLGPWLRMGGALGGVGVCCSVWDLASRDGMGMNLFNDIHLLLLWLICALVPGLTADCLARERREGTLGLLFLTSLTATGIVLGKTLAHVLRALTLWLALLPLLTIPFLVGGVTWADVAGCLVTELCFGMLCLAAGILASSLTDQRAMAFILAFLLMGVFVGAPFGYHFSMLQNPFAQGFDRTSGLSYGGPSFAPVRIRLQNGRMVYMYPGMARRRPIAAPATRAFIGRQAEKWVAASIVLLAALRFAGWRVERAWQDKIPSVRQQNWVKDYCTPLFERWFAGRMRRTKEWNPIAWLQQYSWKARASKWGLCLLFLLLECAVMDPDRPYEIISLVAALLVVLAAAYTYAGVNGFLQEKRNGALELILVSPLSIKQIITGRVWGLWKQFLPSVILLVASDIAVHTMLPHAASDGFWVVDLEASAIYLNLPIFATFCALRVGNLFVAAALTWLALLAAAFAGFAVFVLLALFATQALFPLGLAAPLSPLGQGPFYTFLALLTGNILVAGVALLWLGRNLRQRSYAFR